MLNLKKLLTKLLQLTASTGLTSANLNRLTTEVETTSFNHPEGTGVWYVSAVSTAAPANMSQYGLLLQMRSPFTVHPSSSQAVYTQVFFSLLSGNNVYTRTFNNNAWSAWKTL